MKHLLIVNPKSGNAEERSKFEALINASFKGLDFQIHYTSGPKEATAFLRKTLKNNNDITRVYACGGDGTVHECVNGIIGFDNAELAIYPDGTGNDFIKVYAPVKNYKDIVFGKSATKRFLDFNKLINGEAKPIDVSKINSESLEEDLYSVNVINFGFDAIVGAMGNYYKDHGIPADAKKNEKDNPYVYALNHDAMKRGRFNDTIVYADGEKLNDKQILLGTISQGQFVGGEFWCAPKSNNSDGLMDICVLKTMTFLGLGLIINPYKQGKLLKKPHKKVVYRRAKQAVIDAPQDIDVCVDGEMIKGKHFEIEIVPAAIKLVIPE